MNLPGPLADEMLEHLRRELPNEGCGLLAGRAGVIEAVYCLNNADRSPTSFTIDPTGHFEALQDAERCGRDLIGAFHSHVDGAAYPSSTDIAGAAEPEWLWVIVGPMAGSPEMRAYWIADGAASEQELAITRQ